MSEQLDPVLNGLDADMKVAGSEEDEQALKKQIKAREDALLPMYLQVILCDVARPSLVWSGLA